MLTIAKTRYWLLTVAAIFSISVFGRKLQQIIMERLSQKLIAFIVFAFLFLVLAVLWRNKEHYHVSAKMILIAAVMLALAVAAVSLQYLYPIEAVHFLIFSWFGWISTAVFGPLYGAAAIFSIAIGDEILQHFLPSRVGDLHDVVVNLLSGYTGLILRQRW